MKITTYLNYYTQYGEQIFLVSDKPSQTHEKVIPLEFTEKGWTATFYTDEKEFSYYYIIKRGTEVVVSEETDTHQFGPFAKSYKTILIYDCFELNARPSRMMRSSVFSKAIRYHATATEKKKSFKVPVIFNTWSDSVNYNHKLSIIGNCAALGKWNESDCQQMNALAYPKFQSIQDAGKLTFPLEYKYAITDAKQGHIICWEEGYNHVLNPDFAVTTDLVIVNDPAPSFHLPHFKGAGTAVPVFSLRTKESFGCGEFCDLKKLGDWAQKTGQRIIQTLPINDTTVFGSWRDSYPYSAISVYALHPMYINIEKIGALSDSKEYKKRQKELNAEEFVDYEATNTAKWKFIHLQYKKYGKDTFDSSEYKQFFDDNKDWLKPYAVFSFLRYKHNTSDFSQWGKDAEYDADRIDQYCRPTHKDYKDIAVHFFVQYHLSKQLKESVEYLHSKGIALKGDIPIGVNRNSVDVWQHPDLFDCNGSAGAPPDYFSKTGQIWGFPIYNWKKMEEDDYSWWKKRFKSMEAYFDAYRIDHILGFFRIFRTPTTAKMGLLGQFAPALPLSIEEIEAYGIPFTRELCEPIINEAVLEKIFGDRKNEVVKNYLDLKESGLYQLKPQYRSHEKIEQNFVVKQESDKSIKTGLFYLCCQVLFIEDYKEKGKYHPRICVEQSFLYPTLSLSLQKSMKDIYEYFYYRRHNEFWREEAIKKLTPLINSTNMMVCGEDLGMVPQCVPSLMNELEILSLEIQRMPKEMYTEFGNLSKMPERSVCTTSTHDMSTMRQWWEEERDSIQRYFSNELRQFGEAPLFCEPWICQQIIENHLNSPAAWVILPLQDWMATDGKVRWDKTFNERINDPGNPDNYWRYRMHIRLEDLLHDEEFNDRIQHLIQASNR